MDPRYKRVYEKPEGIRKLYHTSRWTKLQKTILSAYSYLDQWELARKKITPANTVHHIVPADERPDLFFDPSNLVPLSRASHDEVHALYRRSQEDRAAAQARLRAMLKPTV